MVKINRSLATILLVATLAMSAAIGASAAATTTNKIEFNLTEGYYSTFDPATGSSTNVPVSAVINGNIKNRDGTIYISPQIGTITIDGVDNNIQVKNVKQSEPTLYYKYEYGTPGGYYYKSESWYNFVEVNTNGNKYIGTLAWTKYHQEWYGNIYDSAYAQLSFQGMKDGKLISAYVYGYNQPVLS